MNQGRGLQRIDPPPPPIPHIHYTQPPPTRLLTLRRKWWATLKLLALDHRLMQRCFSRFSSPDSGGARSRRLLPPPPCTLAPAVPAAEDSASDAWHGPSIIYGGLFGGCT